MKKGFKPLRGVLEGVLETNSKGVQEEGLKWGLARGFEALEKSWRRGFKKGLRQGFRGCKRVLREGL